MKGTRLLGVVLLVLPSKIEVQDKERVIVPLWAGLGAAIVGGLLLAREQTSRA
jgi:hypothetical protein